MPELSRPSGASTSDHAHINIEGGYVVMEVLGNQYVATNGFMVKALCRQTSERMWLKHAQPAKHGKQGIHTNLAAEARTAVHLAVPFPVGPEIPSSKNIPGCQRRSSPLSVTHTAAASARSL
eukprot:366217-Chlamydomonas_euryale.AAC.20